MFSLVISIISIVIGFYFLIKSKKDKKNNPNLKVGIIKLINTKEDGTYEMAVSYQADDKHTYVEKLSSKKQLKEGAEIIIKVLDDGGIELYKDGLRYLIYSLGYFILVILICTIF